MADQTKKEVVKSDPNFDFFKDTTVRYLGYTNEVGEAFRHAVHVYYVKLSYGVASAYVCCDAADKGYKSWQKSSDEGHSVGTKCKKAALAVTDTLIWQSLASVIIPGFTINRICWGSRLLMEKGKIPDKIVKLSIIAIGLGSIPLIIKPIDHSVEFGMDQTIRKMYGHPAK